MSHDQFNLDAQESHTTMPAESSADILKLEAQQVLDELYGQRLNSFKPTAFKVEWIGFNNYMIYFHDSRLPEVMVSWVKGESFRDVFRTAIVERLSELD
jgi:hypothetical protein